MSDTINFSIDGKECTGKAGQTIVEAAKANKVYVPTLCNYEGLKPAGACRICTVSVAGRKMAACTTPIAEGMAIENKTAELDEMRKAIIEMLFVEGNHYCPSCEKSGNCELQALAYRYKMLAPRFTFLFPVKQIAAYDKILIEHNRCIQCRRCVRAIKSKDGKNIFAIVNRSDKSHISVDSALVKELTDDMAKKAMDLCPVGSIIKKEVGFVIPIGKRKYDHDPIGSEIEN
jgi:[NiFe] hydrogenase diaphorase moiety small subunit